MKNTDNDNLTLERDKIYFDRVLNEKCTIDELAAGGEVTGTISFEQYINDSELTLVYKSNIFSDNSIKVKL